MRKDLNTIPKQIKKKKSTVAPKLEPIKERKPKFNPKIKIIKSSIQANSKDSFQSLKDKPSKKLEKSKKSKKKTSNANSKSYINTLVSNKPLIARQTQYINKLIY
jgi:hypothetical protein